MIRAVCLITMLPLLGAAQQPVPGEFGRRRAADAQGQQAVTYDPADNCTVEGQVTNALTGEPLAKATVTLRRSSGPGPAGMGARAHSATTDASGRFAIAGVPPGAYRLSARRTGFVNAEYGSRGQGRPGAGIDLAARERKTGVLFQMTPHGVVTGRISAEDGEPLEHMHVQAMRYRYTQSGKQLTSAGRAVSNDIGEYRIAGLPPGKYFLVAAPASPAQGEEDYVPTWFPGTADAAAAAAVNVGPGEQYRGMNLTLFRRRTASVRGRIIVPQRDGRQRLMVVLRARGLSAPTMNRPARVDANGNFEFRGVAPGSYTLIAAVPGRGAGLTARLPVEVGGSDVDNLSLTLNPPLTLAGRVRADVQGAANLSGVRVGLRPREQGMFGAPPSARVEADGSFQLANVNADEYDVMVSGLPDGLYVKAIVAGGQDVLLPGLDLNRGIAGAIDILLSPNAGQAVGVAQNDRQEPAAGATVVLVPEDKERKGMARFYRTATADDAGRFTFTNLDPGSYKAYGWSEVEPGAYYDPDFMRPFENAGEPVTIRESGQHEVKLRLIG